MAEEHGYLISAIYQTPGWKSFQQKLRNSGTAVAQFQKTTKASGGKVNKTFTEIKGKSNLVSKAVGEVNKTGKVSEKTFNQLNKSGAKFNTTQKKVAGASGDMTRALRRVAIVVPIWGALRGAIRATQQTLKAGVEVIKDFSLALEKARLVVHSTTKSTDSAMGELESRIRAMSAETGTSLEDLSQSFYRFGTVGLDYEDAVGGMKGATKTAIAMFGDADSISKTLAQTLRLLGEQYEDTVEPQNRAKLIGAELLEVFKDNAFTINEMSQALERFLPTAKVFNFSVEESIGLLASLHTAGLKGSRAGRLLGSSLQRLAQNQDQMVTKLGVQVGESDRLYDVLTKIVHKVAKLTKEGRAIPNMEQLSIFGGVRQKRGALGLVALSKTLRNNMERLNLTTEERYELMGKLDDQYKRVLNTEGQQLKRMENLKKLMGEAFIKGITGAEDFKEGLKEINIALEDTIIPNLLETGKIFNSIFDVLRTAGVGIGTIVNTLTGLKPLETLFSKLFGRDVDLTPFNDVFDTKKIKKYKELLKESANISNKYTDIIRAMKGEMEVDKIVTNWDEYKKVIEETGQSSERYFRILKKINQEQHKKEGISSDYKSMFEDEEFYTPKRIIISTNQEQIDWRHKIIGNLRKELKTIEKQANLIKMQADGYSESEIALQKMKNHVEVLVSEYNTGNKQINKQELLTEAIQGNWYKVKTLLGDVTIKDKEITDLAKERNKVFEKILKKRERLADTMVGGALNLLQLRGATSRQEIETQIALERMLGIRQTEEDILNKQLKLHQSITQEIQDRNKASSQTVKLWEIARKFGKDVALDISTSLKTGESGLDLEGRDKKIFQKYFPSKSEQATARQYFREEAPDIPISERGLPRSDLQQASRSIAQALQGVKIRNEYDIINNINIDGERIAQRIVRNIETEIRKKTSGLREDLRKSIQEDLNEGKIT